jgi:hypothetical protein
MPTAKAYALAILAKFEQAQTDLMGKCSPMAKPGQWKKCGLMNSTVFEFPSRDTMASGRIDHKDGPRIARREPVEVGLK